MTYFIARSEDEMLFNKLISLVAVSYTHLDVYKRQQTINGKSMLISYTTVASIYLITFDLIKLSYFN